MLSNDNMQVEADIIFFPILITNLLQVKCQIMDPQVLRQVRHNVKYGHTGDSMLV